ncbi:MAG: metallophosphoesterase [Alphaproteobacteria bacterium]|nr:metallophosphoesterase [Alphaproteobacteria bacterium]
MFQAILKKYAAFEALYGRFEGRHKALMLHRAFCEVCIEPSRLARMIDNHLPLDVRHHDIPVLRPAEAALDGFCIMHLSDLHLHKNNPAGITRLKDKVRSLSVDLTAATGDFGKGQGTEEDSDDLARDIASALDETTSRHGIHVSLGNHDHPSLGEAFRRVGIHCLESQAIKISHNNRHIILGGFHPAYTRKTPSPRICPLTGQEDLFGIMLCHYNGPYAQWTADHGYRLYLTGHTHGPQIARHYHRGMGDKDKLEGLWFCDEMAGFTTKGVGTSLYPFRLGNRAEVSLLTLRMARPGLVPT